MPAKTKHRVIIDTNLWISYLLTNAYPMIDELLSSEKIELLFSKELIDEFIEVAERPKFRKYFSLDDLQELFRELQTKGKMVEVVSTVNTCRDAKDNFLLALAKDGRATHLITGDKDLLILQKFGRTKILTITEYVAL